MFPSFLSLYRHDDEDVVCEEVIQAEETHFHPEEPFETTKYSQERLQVQKSNKMHASVVTKPPIDPTSMTELQLHHQYTTDDNVTNEAPQRTLNVEEKEEPEKKTHVKGHKRVNREHTEKPKKESIERPKQNSATMEKIKKKDVEERIRRKTDQGSYSNFSVDEGKLYGKKDTILRLTWKGKLVKLRKYLRDVRTHQYINRQDSLGRTALHYAASWDCPQTLKLLLSIPNVRTDIEDSEGNTAFRKACEIASQSCTKLLMEFGDEAQVVVADKRECRNQGEEYLRPIII